MHRVEHIETLTDEDLPRFAALGVAASMQPLHMEGLDDPDTPSAWVDGLVAGRARARLPHRATCARAGRRSPLGSDWMVADYDPRVGHGVGAAAARAGPPERVPYLPGQALDAEQTLRGYTTAPPRVPATRRSTGGCGPACAPTSPCFAQDPLDTPPDELPDVPVGSRSSTATSCSPADPGKSPAAAPLRP